MRIVVMAELQALLENKKEYIDHIHEIMVPSLITEFQNMYSKVNKRNALAEFQEALVKVADPTKIKEIYAAYYRMLAESECTYFGDLVKGIMITFIKINVLQSGTKNKIKLRVPPGESFMLQTMICCARSLWKKPYLFYHEVRSIERQHNLSLVEDLFKKAINSSIRSFLPLDEFFKNTSMSADEESESDSGSESESEEESSEDESEDEDEAEAEAEAEVPVPAPTFEAPKPMIVPVPKFDQAIELMSEEESESDYDETEDSDSEADEAIIEINEEDDAVAESEAEVVNVPLEPDDMSDTIRDVELLTKNIHLDSEDLPSESCSEVDDNIIEIQRIDEDNSLIPTPIPLAVENGSNSSIEDEDDPTKKSIEVSDDSHKRSHRLHHKKKKKSRPVDAFY